MKIFVLWFKFHQVCSLGSDWALVQILAWRRTGDKPLLEHHDFIKWKHFPRYWPFVRGIHRSPVNSPHKSQWRGALKFSLICVWINGWVNNRDAGDLRRYRAHYDVTVMTIVYPVPRRHVVSLGHNEIYLHKMINVIFYIYMGSS